MADPLGRALDVSLISVLETFVHYEDPESAFQAYSDGSELQSFDLQRLATKLDKAQEYAALIIAGNRFAVAPAAFADTAYNLANAANILHWKPDADGIEQLYRRTGIADLTDVSARTLGLTAAVGKHFELQGDYGGRLDRDGFSAAVEKLSTLGLLTAPIGGIGFGDFKRFSPFCPNYGYSRGTPIDRYYLGRFVSKVKDEVVGDILEIGGRKENEKEYGFAHAASYTVMELDNQPGADLIGDAHELTACEAESRDSILLFNVLEHCERPSQVLRNAFEWLRPGGKIFCAVPNAQRVHHDPKDYWRIYPDAFEAMLSGYSGLRVTTYGNLLSCHAALSGIAAEELDAEDLDFHDGRYPVITCAVAEKPGLDAPYRTRS